ncbi:MAG: hypothetical protein AB7F96_06865 [Beijerinckiaceae bacterium]
MQLQHAKSEIGNFVSAGAAVAGLVAGLVSLAAPALAQQAAPVESGSTIVVQTNIDCSIYGPGYVVVQGTTRCVRIGGRMRVQQENGYRGASYLPYAGGAPGGVTLPSGMGSQQPHRPRFWTR